jgi:hypothetical protein
VVLEPQCPWPGGIALLTSILPATAPGAVAEALAQGAGVDASSWLPPGIGTRDDAARRGAARRGIDRE